MKDRIEALEELVRWMADGAGIHITEESFSFACGEYGFPIDNDDKKLALLFDEVTRK